MARVSVDFLALISCQVSSNGNRGVTSFVIELISEAFDI